jgi:nucleoside phosphorylase
VNRFFSDITARHNLQQTGQPPSTKTNKSVLGSYPISEKAEAGERPPRVVIVTARSEALSAVEKYVPKREEATTPDGTIYQWGEFTASDAVWDVAFFETTSGNVEAGIETKEVINHFAHVDVAIFVGVAVGLKDTEIGDVVVSGKVYNYEPGRDEEKFKSWPGVENPSYRLVQRAKKTAKEWESLKKEKGNENFPSAFVRPIASGEKEISSAESETARLVGRNYEDALAGEREGYGFLVAARRAEIPALVIRGISDLLDGKESADKSDSKKIAANNASKFAFDFLTQLQKGASFGKDSMKQLEGPTIALVPEEKSLPEIAVLWFREYEDSYIINARHQAASPFDKRIDKKNERMTLPVPIGKFSTTYPWQLKTLESWEAPHPMFSQLLQWIGDLKEKEPKFSCLVVKEPYSSPVPWELLRLGVKPLGVALQTVRSPIGLDDSDDLTIRTQLVKSSGTCCQGQVMVCIPSKGENYIEDYFPGYQSFIYDSFSHDKLEEIFAHLQKVRQQVGLVILSYSGLQEVTTPTVYLSRTKIWTESASLVMLQSPANENDGLNQRNWAAVLLENRVKGVLEMLENADDILLRQIVSDFFEAYTANPHLPIPEILRRLRQMRAEKLENALDDKNMCQLYISTCLYAYYGHPRAVLDLIRLSS